MVFPSRDREGAAESKQHRISWKWQSQTVRRGITRQPMQRSLTRRLSACVPRSVGQVRAAGASLRTRASPCHRAGARFSETFKCHRARARCSEKRPRSVPLRAGSPSLRSTGGEWNGPSDGSAVPSVPHSSPRVKDGAPRRGGGIPSHDRSWHLTSRSSCRNGQDRRGRGGERKLQGRQVGRASTGHDGIPPGSKLESRPTSAAWMMRSR